MAQRRVGVVHRAGDREPGPLALRMWGKQQGGRDAEGEESGVPVLRLYIQALVGSDHSISLACWGSHMAGH